ncbi:MAG: CDP-alcohol phosphatidyltransferase family protein [Anaerolineae bacterium]|nr:CDP-alcohol phosphatidyltransferase family protein [Anaerolineae bacterium]
MVRYNFQNEYEQMSLIFGKFFLGLGISPDVLTLLSFPLSFWAAYSLAQQHFIWALVAIFLTGVVDVFDGATARAGGTCTAFGTVFDHVVDRYIEFIIFTGVLLSGRAPAVWVMFAISGMIMASYTRSKAESSGGLEKCTVGLVGRTEKLILLGIGIIIEALPLQFMGLQWSLIIIGSLSHITTVQRLLYTRKMILGDNGG